MNKTSIEEQLKQGIVIQTTVGYSMYPLLIHRKTLVKIEKINEELQISDLPLYKRKDQYVIHRIIGVNNGYYQIRGDNTYTIEQVNKEAVIGKVIEIYRNGKWFSVNNQSYKAYSKVWMKTYGLREKVVKVKRRIGRWKRKYLGG